MMKQIKFALIAAFAILIGSTFTSCLGSDDGENEYSDNVTIYPIYEAVISDAGLRYEVQNFTAMQYTDGTYPSRASIVYKHIDGEDYTSGKASYKVSFVGYRAIFYVGSMLYNDTPSLTPINSLSEAWGGGNYLNIAFNMTYNNSTAPDTDFTLYPYKVENGVLYCKLIHTVAVNSTTTGLVYMSFYLPTKSNLQAEFSDLTFTGDNSNIIEVVVTAEGTDGQEISLNKVKVALPN